MITDPVLYWNDAALKANLESHSDPTKAAQVGPVLSSRALAIVHLAMYDAFAGVQGNPANLPAYLPGLPAPAAGASAEAAIASAAHDTLSALYPQQQSDFDTRLTNQGLAGPGVADGLAFGSQVAQAILVDRQNDRDNSAVGYMPATSRGNHQPDPDNPKTPPYLAPFYGANTKCFAVTSRTRHSLDAPPNQASPDYLNALRDVRARGIAPELVGTVSRNATRRTARESLIGIFWAYDGRPRLGTPPRLYNQIVRQVAAARSPSLDLEQNVRLFALVNAAMADAGILAWQEKYKHNLWRPVVAIQQHDVSMGSNGQANDNIDADCDPLWLPMGAPLSNADPPGKNFTPPFPAYPSGHATFGAAALHMTRLFFGVAVGDRSRDPIGRSMGFVSDELNGITTDNRGMVRPRHVRRFPGGLWQMIEENGRSRVYLGIHWLFDAFDEGPGGVMNLDRKIGGVRLGVDIAEDIYEATGGGVRTPKKSTA